MVFLGLEADVELEDDGARSTWRDMIEDGEPCPEDLMLGDVSAVYPSHYGDHDR